MIDDYVSTLFDEMNRYYEESAAAGTSRDGIISGRESMFQSLVGRFETEFMPRLRDPDRWAFLTSLPLNNARILAGVQYQGGLSDYADVLEKTGGNFPDTLGVYAEAARQPDSRKYLREWAAAR